jgi:hypothetical protein
MSKANNVTHEEFVEALEELIDGMTGGAILQIPGAYEVFSEALNNEAIDLARKNKNADDEDKNEE